MVAVNPQTVAEHDKWLLTFDHDAFKADVGALGKRLDKEQGEADVKHLKKICLWSNTCAVLGLATMWLPLGSAANLFSILMLSLVATLLTPKPGVHAASTACASRQAFCARSLFLFAEMRPTSDRH